MLKFTFEPHDEHPAKKHDAISNKIIANGKTYQLMVYDFYRPLTSTPMVLVETSDNNSWRFRIDGEEVREATNFEIQNITECINVTMNYLLNKTCLLCGSHDDVKETQTCLWNEFGHTELKGKQICDKCRLRLLREGFRLEDKKESEKTAKIIQEMKQKGYKYMYTFWIHPGGGDDFAVDVFANKKLTKVQINKEKIELKKKYNARLIEEPHFKII